MPGMTAFFGLLEIGQPKPGETLSSPEQPAPSGCFGRADCEIKGCRVVGIAGSDEKTNYLTKDLGFDAAVNYKKTNLDESLKKACPKGVDVYFR